MQTKWLVSLMSQNMSQFLNRRYPASFTPTRQLYPVKLHTIMVKLFRILKQTQTPLMQHCTMQTQHLKIALPMLCSLSLEPLREIERMISNPLTNARMADPNVTVPRLPFNNHMMGVATGVRSELQNHRAVYAPTMYTIAQQNQKDQRVPRIIQNTNATVQSVSFKMFNTFSPYMEQYEMIQNTMNPIPNKRQMRVAKNTFLRYSRNMVTVQSSLAIGSILELQHITHIIDIASSTATTIPTDVIWQQNSTITNPARPPRVSPTRIHSPARGEYRRTISIAALNPIDNPIIPNTIPTTSLIGAVRMGSVVMIPYYDARQMRQPPQPKNPPTATIRRMRQTQSLQGYLQNCSCAYFCRTQEENCSGKSQYCMCQAGMAEKGSMIIYIRSVIGLTLKVQYSGYLEDPQHIIF